jgi:hypothetical protein
LFLAWIGTQGCATRDAGTAPDNETPNREGCLACHNDEDRLKMLLPPDSRSGGIQRALDDG